MAYRELIKEGVYQKECKNKSFLRFEKLQKLLGSIKFCRKTWGSLEKNFGEIPEPEKFFIQIYFLPRKGLPPQSFFSWVRHCFHLFLSLSPLFLQDVERTLWHHPEPDLKILVLNIYI